MEKIHFLSMKKIIGVAAITVLLVTLSFVGCSQESSSSEKNETQELNTDLKIIEESLDRIMTSTAVLFSYFDDYQNMNHASQYELIKKAEATTDALNPEYRLIMSVCEKDNAYDDIAYQIHLLQHAVPQPIVGDEKLVSTAATLYSLYFQQLSSSFAIISEEIECIENGYLPERRTSFFSEMNKMPRPETIIQGIDFQSKEKEDGIVKYTFLTGDDESDAYLNYNLYLIALGMDESLQVKLDNGVAYVFDDENLVSVIMAGYDQKLSNFFMISFRQ